jgi:hypothetical protein
MLTDKLLTVIGLILRLAGFSCVIRFFCYTLIHIRLQVKTHGPISSNHIRLLTHTYIVTCQTRLLIQKLQKKILHKKPWSRDS